ncbi:conjugal transfer protein TrbC (plasmid) [Rhizorhabdus wittichii DC-6]|uniref:TrbC/VirB2 family protein n=1 Tax=Novosphingobium sp. KN65.2 TaxID=1478134 RepID=UPI0004AB265F|nr:MULTISPECIES: TrbC/VirB2 family protein [Sphingomonadaceae]ARR57691.1 conjugal transfer protein TrbC [Rhizorhabdus wittichii DC-6]CDO34539.1 Conjugal transfer protein TrbC [Novosphingobium sp. KN65.2]
MNIRNLIRRGRAAVFVAVLSLISSPAFAGGSGMPWEDPLQQIADSLTGPVAKIAGILAVALAGLGFAFSEGGGFMRKVLGIVFGLAIAFAASTFFIPFFGFSGGAGF